MVTPTVEPLVSGATEPLHEYVARPGVPEVTGEGPGPSTGVPRALRSPVLRSCGSENGIHRP